MESRASLKNNEFTLLAAVYTQQPTLQLYCI